VYSEFSTGDIVVRVARKGQPLAPGEVLEVKTVEWVGPVRVELERPAEARSWPKTLGGHEYGHQGWTGEEFASASGLHFTDGSDGLIQDFAPALEHFNATHDAVAEATRRNMALFEEILKCKRSADERQSA